MVVILQPEKGYGSPLANNREPCENHGLTRNCNVPLKRVHNAIGISIALRRRARGGQSQETYHSRITQRENKHYGEHVINYEA